MSDFFRLVFALALAAMGCWPTHAKALTTCTADSTALAFGTVDGSTARDTTGTIVVTCTTTAVSLLSRVRVRMCLNIGTGSTGAGQTNPRRMTSVFGDPLQFQIYRDPARSQVWGSRQLPGIPTPVMVDLEYQVLVLGGGASTPPVTMHARIPVQDGLASGGYASSFAGADAHLEYRYAEQLLGTPQYPATCVSGGSGGNTTSFPFDVSATVPPACRAYTTTDLDFGAVPGLIDANRDGTSTIAMTCTGRTAWN